jgi:hypothetical protein
LREWIEAGAAFAILGMAPAQTIQVKDSLAFEFCLRKMFEKPLVGLQTDLSKAIQVGDTLAHRLPPQLAIVCLLTDFELARIVDGGPDP